MICMRPGCQLEATVSFRASAPPLGRMLVQAERVQTYSALRVCDSHALFVQIADAFPQAVQDNICDHARTMGQPEPDFRRATLFPISLESSL